MHAIHPNSRVADLIGLLSVLTNTFGGKAELYKLEKETEVDLDDLMPIVYTADALGFVTVGEGDITVTDRGLEFLEAKIGRRKKLIEESLKHAEPFKTVVELGDFSVDELAESLEKKHVQSFVSPRGHQDLDMLLVEWGVYSGFLRKEGDRYTVLQPR
ncbi:MAG: AAA-associated domain-containing protein [Candidatus Marsarchaeota archaeon]|nr:AAA-associated domain-containing protein [Candidatus Marsarchaeota archaeon]